MGATEDDDLAQANEDAATTVPAPVMPYEDGSYPVPQPGILRDREYESSKTDHAS